MELGWLLQDEESYVEGQNTSDVARRFAELPRKASTSSIQTDRENTPTHHSGEVSK